MEKIKSIDLAKDCESFPELVLKLLEHYELSEKNQLGLLAFRILKDAYGIDHDEESSDMKLLEAIILEAIPDSYEVSLKKRTIDAFRREKIENSHRFRKALSVAIVELYQQRKSCGISQACSVLSSEKFKMPIRISKNYYRDRSDAEVREKANVFIFMAEQENASIETMVSAFHDLEKS